LEITRYRFVFKQLTKRICLKVQVLKFGDFWRDFRQKYDLMVNTSFSS